MSSVKYEWEVVEGAGVNETFGDWLSQKFNEYWGPIGIRRNDANELDDEIKQEIYEFVIAGMKADDNLEIHFPEESKTINDFIGYGEAGQDKIEDVDKAAAEGIIAGENGKSILRDNPYARFNHHLWRSWRLHFVKARKEFNAALELQNSEPAAVPPAEPALTSLQRKMLDIDAELIALNPKVRAAQNLVDSLKEDLKEAKGDLDSLLEDQADLCNKLSIISEGGTYQQGLPFNDTPHPDVEAGKNKPHGTPLLEAAAKAMKVDPAINAAIHDLGKDEIVGDKALTAANIDKLVDGKIDFIFKLEDKIRKASIGGWSWFKDVTGIGKNAASKIEDALEAWRRVNPMPNPEDDDDEPLEVEAAEEEPDTVPFAKELQWWCSECQHEWPVDGENDQCPECENETGNYQFGEFSCPDANAMGVIFRNYEEVQVIDDEGVKCLVQVYEVPDGGWISCIDIQDSETPYMYSNSMNIEDYTSTSRDAAIWNQLSKILGSDDAPESVLEDIETYIELHLSTLNVTCNELYCINCESQYMFDIDNVDSPFCPFCGAAEHTPAD